MLQDINQGEDMRLQRLPSSRLMRAACSGLLAVGAVGCENKDNSDNSQLSDEELKAACADMVEEASNSTNLDKACSDMVKDAKASATTAATKKAEDMCTMQVDDLTDQCAPILLSVEEKTTDSEQKEYTFAALTKRCDNAGGYVEIHGACGGVNDCRGFSYGDWGPDAATLTEHSCSGVNGCLGLSCVLLPEDQGRTGKEIYDEGEFAAPLNNCSGCHAGYYDDEGSWVSDASRFAVFTHEGSTRTVDNWLDRTAAEQERMIAFGVHGVSPDGIAYRTMAAYKDVLSRAEIARVVEYLRTLEPFMWPIKMADN